VGDAADVQTWRVGAVRRWTWEREREVTVGFVLITLERRFLRAVTLPTGETLVRADEAPPAHDAVFERVDLAHGRVALRVADGRYLARHLTHVADGAGPDDDAALHLVGELTACAAFEELPLSDGFLSLRGCDQRFLGVHTNGAVVADRVADGSWERFRYLDVPEDQLGVSAQVEPTPVASALAAV
jgi:hypothetical protein